MTQRRMGILAAVLVAVIAEVFALPVLGLLLGRSRAAVTPVGV